MIKVQFKSNFGEVCPILSGPNGLYLDRLAFVWTTETTEKPYLSILGPDGPDGPKEIIRRSKADQVSRREGDSRPKSESRNLYGNKSTRTTWTIWTSQCFQWLARIAYWTVVGTVWTRAARRVSGDDLAASKGTSRRGGLCGDAEARSIALYGFFR